MAKTRAPNEKWQVSKKRFLSDKYGKVRKRTTETNMDEEVKSATETRRIKLE